VPLDETLLKETKEWRERLLDLQHEADKLKLEYHHAIRKLHAAGGSLREIADELGISHQRVHQIVEPPPSESGRAPVALPFTDTAWPRRLHRRAGSKEDYLGRFTDNSRQTMASAQEQARALRHNYVGTEHILLGLALTPKGHAARALGSLGITVETIRAELVRQVGEGESEPPPGTMPFTPRAKGVVEAALRESIRQSNTHIGTEHLLLGMLAEPECVGARILAALGADAKLRDMLRTRAA
jgi:ClpA/ClpB-like protein